MCLQKHLRGSIVTKEQTRDQGLWTGRQLFLSLCLLTMLCAGFYLMGLYIGKWSSMPAQGNAELKASPAIVERTVSADTQAVTLPPPSEKYSIQVASVESQADADELLKKLRRAGFDSAHKIEPEPNSVNQIYMIRVGPYKLDIAHQVADELRQEHGFKDAQVMPRPVE
jgi:hypothetical protein